MKFVRSRRVRQAFAAALLMLGSAAAMAQDHAVVDGIRIYLGVVPVTAMSPAERTMHGGAPQAPGQYHVTVALYDDATGKRIADATVRARVTSAIGASAQKDLELMAGQDAMTYGNYFAMPERGDYKVTLDIYRPGMSHVVVARLDYQR
jgi:hypothetical protein